MPLLWLEARVLLEFAFQRKKNHLLDKANFIGGGSHSLVKDISEIQTLNLLIISATSSLTLCVCVSLT